MYFSQHWQTDLLSKKKKRKEKQQQQNKEIFVSDEV